MSVLSKAADIAVRWSRAERVAAFETNYAEGGHTSRAAEDRPGEVSVSAAATMVCGGA